MFPWLDDEYKRMQFLTYFSASGATIDLEFEIPDYWDDFWETIDDDGYAIRIVNTAGTVVPHQLTGWDKANRTGTIELDAVAYTANTTLIYALYYGHDSPTNGGTSLTITSAESLEIFLGDPTASGHQLLARRDPPGSASPVQRVSGIEDARYLFVWELELRPAAEKLNGRFFWEYPTGITHSASGVFEGGIVQNAPTTNNVVLFNDRVYIVQNVSLDALAVGTYTLQLKYLLADPTQTITREETARALLEIFNLTEA